MRTSSWRSCLDHQWQPQPNDEQQLLRLGRTKDETEQLLRMASSYPWSASSLFPWENQAFSIVLALEKAPNPELRALFAQANRIFLANHSKTKSNISTNQLQPTNQPTKLANQPANQPTKLTNRPNQTNKPKRQPPESQELTAQTEEVRHLEAVQRPGAVNSQRKASKRITRCCFSLFWDVFL